MADNVKVAVRMRPYNQRERDMNAKCCIRMLKDTQQTVIVEPETGEPSGACLGVPAFQACCRVIAAKERLFTFDFSYNSFVDRDDPEYASQDQVWSDIGVGVLQNAYEGRRLNSPSL